MELKNLDVYSCVNDGCQETFYVKEDNDPDVCPYCSEKTLEFSYVEEVAFEE